MEEDENGDDKMAVEEEKAPAESKGTRAVSDVEMKEVNEPAVPDAEMKDVNTHHMTTRRSKSRSESLSEGDGTSSAGERSETKGKHSPAEPTPNQEKRVELDESEGSSPQLEKTPNESDLEEKVCLNTFGVCLYSYILLVSNLC